MAKGDHTFKKRPKGAKGGGYARPRVQIGFDKRQMAIITKLAQISNRSFAAEVRALLDTAIKSRVPLITPPSPDQESYLREIEQAATGFDPTVIVGGPDKRVTR